MKKLVLISILAGFIAGPVAAVPTVTVDRGDDAVYNLAIGGGEFRIVPNQDLIDITAETGPFLSFCLEAHEPIDDQGNTEYFASILTEAITGDGGSGSGPLGGDLLDPMTAYLYTQFRQDTLSGYTGDLASAGALQEAIWYIEQETGHTTLSALSDLAKDFINHAENTPWTDIGNVRVLHLWMEDTEGKPVQVQDMLVMVPAPAAVLLGGIGVCLVGWLRRRRTL